MAKGKVSRSRRRRRRAPESSTNADARELDDLDAEFVQRRAHAGVEAGDSLAPSTSAAPDVDDTESTDLTELTPEVLARRLRRGKIVFVAVAACAVLCVVAGIRLTSRSRAATFAVASEPPRAVRTASEPDIPAAEPTPAEPTPGATDVLEDAGASQSSTEAVAAAKRSAIYSLERHRIADAIAAASRATSLDDHDGEAWLILGAAQQETGDLMIALASYRTCVSKGRVDPRGECAAMLRSLAAPGR